MEKMNMTGNNNSKEVIAKHKLKMRNYYKGYGYFNFEKRSHYVSQVGHELLILHLLLDCCDYRCTPPSWLCNDIMTDIKIKQNDDLMNFRQ